MHMKESESNTANHESDFWEWTEAIAGKYERLGLPFSLLKCEALENVLTLYKIRKLFNRQRT